MPSELPLTSEVKLVVTGEELQNFLRPMHVQIRSPFNIPAEHLAPFYQRRKQILIIEPQSKRNVPARLQALYNDKLVAEMTQVPQFKTSKGKKLLVVFSVSQGHPYIVNTQVDEIYTDRLTLRYLDPRVDVRRQVPTVAPVQLRLAPAVVLKSMQQRMVNLMREIHTRLDALDIPLPVAITDFLDDAGCVDTPPYEQTWRAMPPLYCQLLDISLGGVGLGLNAVLPAEKFVGHMAMVTIELPNSVAALAESPATSLTLHLFSGIRRVNTTGQPCTLHLIFLHRLPPACDTIFANLPQLESQADHTQ